LRLVNALLLGLYVMAHNNLAAIWLHRPMQLLLRHGKGRLSPQIHGESFDDAFINFSDAAEAFALTLSDEVHRDYAFQYSKYLRKIAEGIPSLKPNPIPGPAGRLIRAELDRVFELSFVLTAIAA
jgi:hypothetical protein